jgi:hypothetical protein
MFALEEETDSPMAGCDSAVNNVRKEVKMLSDTGAGRLGAPIAFCHAAVQTVDQFASTRAFAWSATI